ncbi:arsenical-resistance protein ACR3 [Cutaneotrichosporon oleaginosum]|uniref:Arsenical-resistance protein ACR3 n=1 Tax=Cutaneotrichosporon oleaginosum TaxID=879819 RepID=A0A0J0XH76_9TREE|nr:arsenical-resistance protein ACR3 [Cutaneotrichosporon oleaginosum]KLT40398.1 arsenical-resistance protein ACR3 [Cutaneotrichosporon oleaginosum]TXT11363.1 hypothetical protein COLE_01773 [Cutaneotrichosporon oleaginosum]
MSTLERRRPASTAENENSSISVPDEQDYTPQRRVTARELFKGLSWLDRLLSILILVAMILGVVIGKFVPNTKKILSGATLDGVSIPIVIGLLVMMWPILTKVQYERFARIFGTSHIWKHLAISIVLNWLIAPFLMLGLAWATLPDQPTYRTGVIIVGLARCIAMVMIWNHLARGDINYCAILVIVNSVLQIALFSPMSILFVNILSREDALRLEYGKTAIAVLIYLGIPLAAGVVTRFAMLGILGRRRFENVFLPWFSPLSLLGLLYTIIIICAEQATRILDNIGLVFRVFVPLTLYFVLMWAGTFALGFYLNHKRGAAAGYSYEAAVVQSFTAASNNFELAIAVCVAVYGVDSDQALAATIGPLVEVPVLLLLTHVALLLRAKLKWDVTEEVDLEMEPLPAAGAPAAASTHTVKAE